VVDQREITMPLAVVMEEPELRELKTCPGGYVYIKRMSFGEKLERRKFNSKMDVEMQRGSRSAKSSIDIFNEDMEIYDFMHCIDSHNLTKLVNKQTGLPTSSKDPEAVEVALDFTKAFDIKLLAGQIAEEIGTAIDKLNNFEEDEEVGNSNGASENT